MPPACYRPHSLCRLFLLSEVLLLSIVSTGFADQRPDRGDQQTSPVDASAVAKYVRACRKPNGAFGPRDQQYTDAAWNYPAVHTLSLLGAKIEDPAAVLRNGLGYPTGHAGYGHWLVYHQSLIRWLLAEPEFRSESEAPAAVSLIYQGEEIRYYGSPFATKGEALFQASGVSTAAAFRTAETLGYYNLSSLYYTAAAVIASGRTVEDVASLVRFIRQRQAPGGGFVDVRSAGTVPTDDEAHLAHTYHAVATLRLLGAVVPNQRRVIAFVRSCQNAEKHRGENSADVPMPPGGFLFHPDHKKAGNLADVYYTWCGVQVLHLLDSAPLNRAGCVDWLNCLQNQDGGFGDRPGWRSRLYSTYYAVHALSLLAEDIPGRQSAPDESRTASPTEQSFTRQQATLRRLCGLHRTGAAAALIRPKRKVSEAVPVLSDPELRIYQGLFKTPVVSPGDLAGLHERGFDQIAMKTEDFSAAAPLLTAIETDSLPLSVLLCPEAYPHRLRRHGGAMLHHVGNFVLDPTWNDAQRAVWQSANAEGQRGLSWDDYRQKVLAPLQELGSLCYPEQDFEMEYAYSAYDAGVAGQHGYNAVQVGFNWSPRDFVRVFPWRERYTDKLPPVADADAHGDLKKWSPQLDHVRHLYIARGPGHREFVDAAQQGRVVCVITSPEGVSSGVSLYGSPGAVRYVRARIDQWQWWLEAPGDQEDR